MYEASPDVVFEALLRAVVASGATLQGSDPRNRTVYFKRGRTNESASVRIGPQGSYLVGSSTVGLHELVAAEIENMPSQAPPAEAAVTSAGVDLAGELERLGDLRERNLLTDEEFAAAKERAFAQTGLQTTPTPTKAAAKPAEPSPPPPIVSELDASGADVPPVGASATKPVVTPPTGTSRLGSWLETWHGLSRTKQIVIAVVVVLVALAVLGALVPSEGDDEPSTSPAPPPTSTESGNGTEPNQQLVAWSGDAAEWADQQGEALGTLGSLLQDDGFNTRLLLGDQDAVIEAAIPLAVLQQCTNNFPDPPAANAQARKVTNLVHQACAEFETSADEFSRGVDNVNTDLINSAASRMARGTEILTQATDELVELQTSGG